MAGLIIYNHRDWSAASWLFYTTLDFAIEAISEPHILARLGEISENNLGSLDLDDFSAQEQMIIRTAILTVVIPRFEAMDFATVAAKPETIKQLDELRAILE